MSSYRNRLASRTDGQGQRVRREDTSLAQVVQVAVGDVGEALEAQVAEHFELAPQHCPCGWPRQLPEQLVRPGQKPNVGRS